MIRLILVTLLSLTFISRGSDTWPQFRGPGGEGHSDATGLPLTWSETENVKWKVPIPGDGWSSPVVANNQIWMTTSQDLGKSLRAVCADLESGKILHDIEVFNIEVPPNKHKRNSFASPTPVLEDGFVYVHFGTCGTACLATKTGEVVWRNTELKLNHENGPGSSPIIYKDKLIVCCDGIDVRFLVALNKKTGQVVWKTDRSGVIDKPPPRKKAYSTPLVINVAGKDQVITPAAEFLYAYEPDGGKELWFVKYPGYSNVARPIYGHGMLYVGTGFERHEIWAIRPEGSGDLTAGNVAWRYKIQAPAQCSPLLVGGNLYMVSDAGTATCLDAKTGTMHWSKQLGKDFAASPVFAEGRIYFFDAYGVATVIEPGNAFKALASNTLDDGFMASAAIVGKAFILRTKKHLYRVENAK